MTREKYFDANLADFQIGHDTDPLAVMPEFVEWRQQAASYHALFERRLAGAPTPHTRLQDGSTLRRMLNMASLDYLGMGSEASVVEAQQRALGEWGSGAAGVPLLSGMSTQHDRVHDELRRLSNRNGAMLFSSGFVAAIGFAIGFLRRGDLAVLDERAHMSWIDGVRAAGARLVTFAHNDPLALDAILGEHPDRRKVVIVDGLYSMDGDFAPLDALLDVTDAHGVGLVVDEAHSVFADGLHGGGVTERFGEQQRVRVLMGTFSKALGMIGGFLCADEELLDYLRYYAHPYVFSSAMPPATAAGIAAAMQVSRPAKARRDRLRDNADYFRGQLQALGLDTGWSESWIVPIILGNDRELLFESVQQLAQAGLYVAPVDFPAVPEDQVRIRCAVSAAHTRADLDTALNLIEHHVARPWRQRNI